MPSLLKSADLSSAHIIRGRLQAEGHLVDVVHECASQLWGGAVTGGPVLVSPAADYPEVEDCVATVEEIEPPPEAAEGGLPLPPACPGLAGSALTGASLVALAVAIHAIGTNLFTILAEVFRQEYFDSGPIPLYLPHPPSTVLALIGGAAAGTLIFLGKIALRDPVGRWFIAFFVLLFNLHVVGLAVAGLFVVAELILQKNAKGN